MTVQIKIDPTTGLTASGNRNDKEKTCQLIFSVVQRSGIQGYGLGIPNVLRNAEQLISLSMTKHDTELKDVCYEPHAYWSVDHRPKGTKQIVDSGLFTYLYGGKKNAPLKEVERYADYYCEFVNTHFKKHCFTNNTPWFVELDLHGRFPIEDYHRIQKMMFDRCPNADFIGVWHDEWGLKQLDEVCERFDYVSLSLAGGWNWNIVFGVLSYINKKYPGKCIHLLGTSAINSMTWGGLVKLVDTCDCTAWLKSCRYGLSPCPGIERGKWVKPAEMFINEHLLKYFPRNPKPGTDPISGWTPNNRESAVWTLCSAWCEYNAFSLYGEQKHWPRGSMRRVVQKTLEGRGAELTEDDITEPLYETEFVPDMAGFPFWTPVDKENGWHYKDKFKDTVKFIKSL